MVGGVVGLGPSSFNSHNRLNMLSATHLLLGTINRGAGLPAGISRQQMGMGIEL